MIRRFPLLLLALLALPAAAQHAQHAHQHGVGRLDIALEGETLSLMLEMPQHDLVGFERAPRNAREQATAQAALERLNTPERLFAPTAAAGCRVQEKSVEAPLLDGASSADGHGDVDAAYIFQCTTPAALKDVRVLLIDAFPGLRTLNVSFAGPRGQKAGRLDAGNPVFAW